MIEFETDRLHLHRFCRNKISLRFALRYDEVGLAVGGESPAVFHLQFIVCIINIEQIILLQFGGGIGDKLVRLALQPIVDGAIFPRTLVPCYVGPGLIRSVEHGDISLTILISAQYDEPCAFGLQSRQIGVFGCGPGGVAHIRVEADGPRLRDVDYLVLRTAGQSRGRRCK